MAKFLIGVKCLFTICLLTLACHHSVDNNFKIKFQNQISKLELLKSEGISLRNTTDSVNIASQTLFLITGVEPKISRNFSYVYYEDDFRSDSIKWSNWYQQNKLKAREYFFDSVYSKVLLKYKSEQ
jgi:hypothetical protein